MTDIDAQIQLGYQHHSRLSEFDRLVYPVVSRRSRGLSLGINMNPDKRCNFDCVYCQVEREGRLPPRAPDLTQLEQELRFWLERIAGEGFRGYPLRDIALAGDGEPSVVRELPAVLSLLRRLKQEFRLQGVRLVLFTNGSGLERADLVAEWDGFYAADGEVWFKLDYWDQASLEALNRTRLRCDRLLATLDRFAARYPVTLQSCFFNWGDIPFRVEDYAGYRDCVKERLKQGCRITKIQAYTLARQPTESAAKAWGDEEMRCLGAFLRQQLPVPLELYFERGEAAEN
ncbi:hypothetical protein [Motiliproteus sediminis]|uniref:hypothetical protein n=1 Tax=Motiliproteus sediminis TaxID=1468178 RepID=UPI001AF00C8B|nr:hypothetical protein [Motiliproteus sediminis]